VLINNLSKQILSLHILHFITAHFTFITAEIGYHCTLKFGMLFVQRVLLTGADLMLNYGHRYGLIGRNGVGKTTLLRSLSQ
jgi:ABC-type multidrug transport system ATPase subunit